MRVQKLSRFIGAEITDLDLSNPLSASQEDSLYNALMEHQVVFLRDQAISPARQLELASSFGDLEPPHPLYPHVEGHPQVMLLDFDETRPPDTDTWHTDVTYKPNPAFASVLYSRVIPPYGGDTLWASMTAAYDALPEGLKMEIADKRAVHDMSDFRNTVASDTGDGYNQGIVDAHVKMGSTIHPMVQRHPVTGQPHLYCNPGFTMHVMGESSTGSRRLLNYLFDHMCQPEFQVRFKWTENTLALWDNRCTMHCALGDYLPYRRVMNRVTVVNDRRADGVAQAAE